jgi:hypothetical protein
MSNAGYVYALVNESMEGLIKVGETEKTPKIRAQELSGATGVATSFTVAFQIYVSNRRFAETQVHELLERYRVSTKREFFRVSLEEVSRIMLSVALGDITKMVYKAPEHMKEDEEGLLQVEQSDYEWWSFVSPKRIIEYKGKPCHLSVVAFSYKIRWVKNGQFTVAKETTKNEQECFALRNEIKLIDIEVPTEPVSNVDFWIEYLEGLSQNHYTFIQF